MLAGSIESDGGVGGDNVKGQKETGCETNVKNNYMKIFHKKVALTTKYF